MNNAKGEAGKWSHVVKSYELSAEDIDQVKQYVQNNAMGESWNVPSLIKFINIFLR